jgi:DNA-directed RNA polymerase specialized sigma24 family protein
MKTSVISISSLDNLIDGETPSEFLPEHLRGGDNARKIRYLKQELMRVIDCCLTENQREYLLKHYWRGTRRSDIAREHGVGAAQVTKSIHAAQKIIRERLLDFIAVYDRLERDLLDEL